MKPFVQSHFLSTKDEGRFLFFVAFAFLLLLAGAMNKDKEIHFLPSQNQIIDSKPKQSDLPAIRRQTVEKSDFRKV
jgi:hypothetical protein